MIFLHSLTVQVLCKSERRTWEHSEHSLPASSGDVFMGDIVNRIGSMLSEDDVTSDPE